MRKVGNLLSDGGDLLGDGGVLLGDGVDLLIFGVDLLGDGGSLLGDGVNLLGGGGDLLGDGGDPRSIAGVSSKTTVAQKCSGAMEIQRTDGRTDGRTVLETLACLKMQKRYLAICTQQHCTAVCRLIGLGTTSIHRGRISPICVKTNNHRN